MNFSQYRISDIQEKIDKYSLCYPVDIVITGVTGAGKSTTLNTLFQKEVAKVGKSSNPETMELDSYKLNEYIRIWDTPGLGDEVDKDLAHKNKIQKLLCENVSINFDVYGFSDLAIIVIEGSKKDLGTTRVLLKETILPNIESNRVLVIINQADIAMKGRNWDYSNNLPNQELKNYLDEFASSLKKRIKEDTGLEIPLPVYYSAERNYNMEKVLDFIIDNLPQKKREAIDIKSRTGECSDVQFRIKSYAYEEHSDCIGLDLKQIKNSSSWRSTGELMIVCWVSKDKYSFENDFKGEEHHPIEGKWVGHLRGGESIENKKYYFYFNDVMVDIIGYFHFVFTINELSDDGKWYIIDYINTETEYIKHNSKRE